MRPAWLAVVFAPACSFTPGMLLPSDAEPLDEDADFTTGWSMPVKIPGLEDAAGADDPSMTNDLLEIYFGSSRTGSMGLEDIWVAKRATVNDPFGTPTPVVELNSPLAETTMKITGGGKSIYFASNRDMIGHEIYMSTRAELDQPWSTPVRVAELSSSNGDWAPFAQTDQLRIVLCSGPTQNQEALFVSTRASTGDPWATPVRVAELDDPAGVSECDPNEPRSNVLYYSSNLYGTFDIFRASRTSSMTPYGNRTPLNEVNLQTTNDVDPWVSPDERTMVFASDRDQVNMQLYITTRR